MKNHHPQAGFTLVEIDYNNAENVMAAMISGDDNLAEACMAEDFHSVMGSRYFGAEWEHADADERKGLRTLMGGIRAKGVEFSR